MLTADKIRSAGLVAFEEPSILDLIRGDFVPGFCKASALLLETRDKIPLRPDEIEPICISILEAAEEFPLRKQLRIKELLNAVREKGYLDLKAVKMIAVNFSL
jgi:hypothetical protein